MTARKWEAHPTHKGKAVTEFLLAGAGWKHVVPLGKGRRAIRRRWLHRDLARPQAGAFLVQEAATEASGLPFATSIASCATPRESSRTCRLPPPSAARMDRPGPPSMASRHGGRTRMENCCCSHRPDSFGLWAGRLSPPEPLSLTCNTADLPKVFSTPGGSGRQSAGLERLRQGCFVSGRPR